MSDDSAISNICSVAYISVYMCVFGHVCVYTRAAIPPPVCYVFFHFFSFFLFFICSFYYCFILINSFTLLHCFTLIKIIDPGWWPCCLQFCIYHRHRIIYLLFFIYFYFLNISESLHSLGLSSLNICTYINNCVLLLFLTL